MKIQLNEILMGNSDIAHIDHEYTIDSMKVLNESYPAKSTARVQGLLRKTGEKDFLLEGQVTLTIAIPCSRCTETVDYPIQASFSKDLRLLNEYERENMPQDENIDDEQEYLTGYVMDLEKLVFDELYMNFPMKVLCDEACSGICMQCGVNLNEQSCDCISDNIDPRLAGLQDLLKEL